MQKFYFLFNNESMSISQRIMVAIKSMDARKILKNEFKDNDKVISNF